MNGRQARLVRFKEERRIVHATLSAVVGVLNRGFWGRMKWLVRGK